jgi:hypothetical protein
LIRCTTCILLCKIHDSHTTFLHYYIQVMCGFLPASDSLPIFPASEHKPLAGVSDHRKSQDIIDSLRRKVCHHIALILAKPLILYPLRTTAQDHVILCKAALTQRMCAQLHVLYHTAHISMVVNIYCALYLCICLGCAIITEYKATGVGIRSSTIICTGFTQLSYC